jgi:hypothetical protein
MAMQLFWSAFYLMLSWYLERVFPGEYGVKLPFYFPFMVSSVLFFIISIIHLQNGIKKKKSYWFENLATATYKSYQSNSYDEHQMLEDKSAFEKDPNDLYASVKIKNLTKVSHISKLSFNSILQT